MRKNKKFWSSFQFLNLIAKPSIFINFLGGIFIGGIFLLIFSEILQNIIPVSHNQAIIKEFSVQSSLRKVQSIRILCMVNTHPKNHQRKAIHVQQTWGRHCDKLIFASSITDVALNVIGFNMTAGHDYVWGKEKLMMQYVYKNYLNQYDWFFKADDDTFMIMENLRLLLSSYSPEDPIYFGHKFNTSRHRWGYFSGGSGYVLSRFALRTFVGELLTNKTLCPMLSKDFGSEDMNVPICLAKANVYAGDSRDWVKRSRFFADKLELFMFRKRKGNNWYWKRLYYNSDGGLDCCSNYSISFHYLPPRYLYKLYYLSNHLKPYGMEYRHPTLPKKFNFKNVARTLELERINKSYRGY